MRPYDGAKQGAVLAFRDKDCANNTGRFYANSDPDLYAEYNKAAIKNQNMYNDDIDAIMVPYGYAVTIYWDNNFSGKSKTFEGGPFIDKNMSMRCINVDAEGFGDKATSLRVYRTSNLGDANGTWKAITASSGIKFKVSYGM